MLLLAAAVYIATTVHAETVTGCSEDGFAPHTVGTLMPLSLFDPRADGKIFSDKLAVRLLQQNFGKQRFVFASPWLAGHRETIASELSAALASATVPVNYYSAKGKRIEDLSNGPRSEGMRGRGLGQRSLTDFWHPTAHLERGKATRFSLPSPPTALDALKAYLSSHGVHLDDENPLPASAVLRKIVQHDNDSDDGGSNISAISAELAKLFAREVNVNAYISAPRASALAPHTDT